MISFSGGFYKSYIARHRLFK